MSKQNGTRAREVLLVLDLDKTVHLRLQAPGIPLQLAYVSDPKPYAEALARGGLCLVNPVVPKRQQGQG